MSMNWIWPIVVAVGQAGTVYGLMFLHNMVRVVAKALEVHIEAEIKHHQPDA